MRYILIIALLFNVASAQSLFGVVAGDGFDQDAKRYLDSAGITNSSQRSAFNAFVKGWKNAGLWTKTSAIYPFMGGSASSHKWNAKDVRDLDAAFRLTFPNGATHDANGITFNGTNQYALTFFNPNNNASSNNSFAMGIYSRTNSSANQADMYATLTTAGNPRAGILSRWGDGNFYGDMWDDSETRIMVSNSDSRGIFIASRTASNSFKAYRNGSQIGSTSTRTSIESGHRCKRRRSHCWSVRSDTPMNFPDRSPER